LVSERDNFNFLFYYCIIFFILLFGFFFIYFILVFIYIHVTHVTTLSFLFYNFFFSFFFLFLFIYFICFKSLSKSFVLILVHMSCYHWSLFNLFPNSLVLCWLLVSETRRGIFVFCLYQRKTLIFYYLKTVTESESVRFLHCRRVRNSATNHNHKHYSLFSLFSFWIKPPKMMNITKNNMNFSWTFKHS